MIEKTLLLQTIQKTLFPKYNPKCNPFLGYYHSTFMMRISLTTSMVLTNYYSSKSSFTVVKQKESNKSINSLKTNKSNKSDKSIISKSNKYPILKDVKECKTITIKTDNRVCNSSNLRGLVRSPSLVFIVKVGKSINSRKNSLELIRIRKKSMTLVNLLKILYGIFYKWFIGVLTTVLLLISSVFYLTNRGNGDEVLDNNTEESILDDIEETEIDFVQEETESGFEQEESVELLKDPVISSVISNYPEGLIKDIDYPKEYIDDDNINNINNVDGLINNDDDDVNNVDEFINNDDEIINNVDDNNNNNNNNNNNIIIVENPTDNVLVIVGDLESLEKGKGKEIVNPDNVLEIVGDLESLEKGKGKEIVNPDNVLEIVGDLESLEKGKEIVSPDNVLEIVGDLESLEKDKGKGKGKEIVNTDHSETNLASFSTNEDLYFEQSFRLFMHDGKYLLLSNNALDIEWLNNLKDLSNTTITEESGIQKVNLTIDTEVAQELVYNNNNEELLSTSEVPRTGEGGVYLDNQLRNILDSLLTNGEVTIISPEIAPVSPTTSIDLVTPYTARSPDPINTLPISLDNQYSNLDSLKNSGNFVRCEDPDSLEVSKTHPIPLDLWWEVPPKPSDSEALKAWERDLITRKYWVNRLEESGSNWNEIHISLTTDTLSMENSSSVSDKTVNKSISLLDNIDEGDLANLFNDIDNPNNTYLSKEYEESLVQTNKQTSKPANNGVGELNNIEEGDLERLFSEDTKRSSVPIISGFLSVGLRTIKDLVNKLNNATFKDNKEDIDIIVKDVINNSITTLNEIKNINSKGYVNSYDLMDSINYPNLSHIIKTITARDKKGEIYKNLTPKDMIVLSKWGHQVLLLQLYTFLVNTPKNLSESRDLVLDLDCLINETYGLLDSSIRSKLQNKGLSLIQNTYTGYDTEFQYMEKENINKLLSVQLAVYTKTLLKLPRYTAYTLSTLNPLNNEIYEIAKDNKMNKVLVDEIINGLLQEAKSLSMKSVEYSLNRLVEGLKAMKIPYIENNKEYIFSFRGGTIKEWFNKTDKYTFLELVKVSESLSAKDLDNQQVYIIDLLKKIHNTGPIIKDINNEVNKENIPEEFIGLPTDVKEVPRELMEYVSPVSDRSNKSKYTRTRNQSFTSELVSVTKIRNNHIIGHFINADLTLLEDFEVIKDNLDLVNNCLITLRKPMLIEGVNVHVRDTLLLAPGVKKSLEAIGLLYGEGFKKISIDKEWYDKMEEFLNKHPDDFRKYAMQDALITLVHACHMEDISFNLGGSSIPKTLASLSMLYIKKKWTEDNYKGYQVNESYNLTEANDMLTPKGLSSVGDLGFIIGYYIANYKGGRNESFMYGSNTDTEWFDYDLIGAYTTAMALLGDPDYKRLTRLSAVRLKSMTDEDILYSYIIIKTDFVFKESVKYPSIPCFIDKDITVYPLKGSAILTGAEYLVARNMGCDFVFKDIFLIPFKTVKTEKTGKDDTDSSKDINEIHLKKLSYQPFKECIRELQALRRSHHKTSVYNLIYKAIANSLYGITTKGISNKMRYDFRTKSSVKMKGNDVSNPIIASWITGYVRSVIGELLHNVHALKGVVVSVTTDGFITNIKDLENVILNNDSLSSYLLKSYRFIREDLSGVGVGLELKQSGKGILTWTTRGQYGYEGNITATTGLQRSNYTKEELGELLVKTFNSPDKSTEFIQRSLRSGTDILNKGGMVTPVNRDKIFRMHYDNRRIIEDIPCLGNLRDSKPYNDIETARLNRFVGKLSKSVSYNKNLSVPKVDNSYKNVLDMSVRSFIRGLFNKDYNLDIAVFKSYKEVADFVNCYDPTIRLTPNVIASLKRRPLNTRKILKSNDSVKGFVKHIETKFPSFDKKKFLD